MSDSFPFVIPSTTYQTLQLNYAVGISAFMCVGNNGSNQATLVTASSYANFPVIGLSESSISNGAFAPFVTSGLVINSGWSFSSGKVAVANDGTITQTFTGLGLLQVVGYATGPHSIYFDPQGYVLVRETA
jgi:hypothetical protein